MRKHTEKILRLACVLLGALLLFQVIRVTFRGNPLARVSIPAVPTLATNLDSSVARPNSATNAATALTAAGSGSNITAVGAIPGVNSNDVLADIIQSKTNEISTRTNVALAPIDVQSGTNSLVGSNAPAAAAGTNTTPAGLAAVKAPSSGPRPEMTMMGMPGMRSTKPMPDLPIPIKARIYRIYESELFGQVMRPTPMALLGIAGNSAFLRSPSGQTGLVKEGDSLGEIKLLQIGINRVLVEENGQKKELMIFEGYGGESLLTKQKETPDETTSK